MTTHNEIEALLLRAVEVTPLPDGLRRLDQRVARAMAQPARVDRRGVFTRRLFLRPTVLLAAFILLTGAVVAGATLLEQIFDASGQPGWRTAWDRAEVLHLTQTDHGVTVTLERAYADLNQVLIGFTVEGLEPQISSHGERLKVSYRAELRDPLGRTPEQWAPSLGGTSLYDPELTAEVRTWEGAVAPVAGKWVLTFTSIGYDNSLVSGECYAGNTDPECANRPASAMIDGIWRFEFELPKPSGTVVLPEVSDTQAQATLTLTQLKIAPTMISWRIAMRLADGSVADWHPTMTIRRDGIAYPGNHDYHVTQNEQSQNPNGDMNEFYTIVGSDVAAGTWVIEISELTYRSSEAQAIEQETRLAGPWTLTVTVP